MLLMIIAHNYERMNAFVASSRAFSYYCKPCVHMFAFAHAYVYAQTKCSMCNASTEICTFVQLHCTCTYCWNKSADTSYVTATALVPNRDTALCIIMYCHIYLVQVSVAISVSIHERLINGIA